VLAIPTKRFDRPLLGYPTRAEMEAVLRAPDRSDWSGRRDRALFNLMYNTGARVSDAIGLRLNDVRLGPSAAVQIHGKGQKERCVPLWKTTTALLAAWVTEVGPDPRSPLFPNRFGRPLSRSGVEDRLGRAVAAAVAGCPSLTGKAVSPHTVRHTTAVHLLQAEVDVTLIALWIGHESPETTHQYVEADLEMKRRVLDKLDEPAVKTSSPRPADPLLDYLDRL